MSPDEGAPRAHTACGDPVRSPRRHHLGTVLVPHHAGQVRPNSTLSTHSNEDPRTTGRDPDLQVLPRPMSVSSRTTRTPSDLTFRSAAGTAERRGKAALDSTWHGDTKARKGTQQSQVSRETARTSRPGDPSSSRGGQATQGSEAASEDAGVQEATHRKVSRTRDW